MTRSTWCVLVPLVSLSASLRAQTIAPSIVATDGSVNVIFPSRPNVCGDGRGFIRTSRGHGRDAIYSGSSEIWSANGWTNRPCARGPARILATVMNGEVTRLSIFVGPLPSSPTSARTLTTRATDAASWLGELATRGQGRVASQAIRAMMFADTPEPWPLMLRIARNTERPREVRQAALQWLSFGVTDRLGLSDVDEHATEDDEMRTQAVFVLTQRKNAETVSELIDLSRHAKYPSARKAAIFWLGQSGDPRAADVYAELLGIR